jgi:mannose-6-phosphate isomerase-like protein (cupin superfamily)
MAGADARVIDNPSTGERIVVRASAADTGGERLEFDLYLRPGGRVPAGHAHPSQEERFRVVSGRVRFRVGWRSRLVEAGDSVTVPPRTAHWFANAAPGISHVRVEVRPALALEELFRSAAAIDSAHRGGLWRLSDLAAMLLAFRREVAVPGVPSELFAAVLRPVAAAGARRRAAASPPPALGGDVPLAPGR